MGSGHGRLALLLLAIGTIPFAVVAWVVIVPVLIPLLVAALAAPALRTRTLSS